MRPRLPDPRWILLMFMLLFAGSILTSRAAGTLYEATHSVGFRYCDGVLANWQVDYVEYMMAGEIDREEFEVVTILMTEVINKQARDAAAGVEPDPSYLLDMTAKSISAVTPPRQPRVFVTDMPRDECLQYRAQWPKLFPTET